MSAHQYRLGGIDSKAVVSEACTAENRKSARSTEIKAERIESISKARLGGTCDDGGRKMKTVYLTWRSSVTIIAFDAVCEAATVALHTTTIIR